MYNDSGGSPGIILGNLLGSTNPLSDGPYTYTYTNSIPLALTPNTTYWIVASTPDTTGGANYIWKFTPNTTVDPGSIWTIGVAKFNVGGSWTSTSGKLLFSVIVPPPTSPPLAIFSPLVLTYTNNGFGFVLQQNTNLSSTNWVTAINAIQINTANSNISAYLVSPSSPQLFYRLQSQ